MEEEFLSLAICFRCDPCSLGNVIRIILNYGVVRNGDSTCDLIVSHSSKNQKSDWSLMQSLCLL